MLALARSTSLRHPSGVVLKTPLLVPSFSSKGLRQTKKGRSELSAVFRNSASVLTETMLISAYDVHYRHLPRPERFPATATLTFVDSGGYETRPHCYLPAVYQFGHSSTASAVQQPARVI